MTSDLGTIVDVDGRPVLRFERRLAASVDRAWRAVTDEDEMAAWFPSRVEGERKVGAPLQFPFEGGEAPTFDGEVRVWDPPRVFEFTWHHDVLRFELAPDGEGTRLTFTQTLVDRSEGARTGSGWHVCLGSLGAHLGTPEPEADWGELFHEYLLRMGPPPARREGSELVFERKHHLDPQALREIVDAWEGAGDWDWRIEAAAHGCDYEVRIPLADATAAARSHATLVEIDLYAASGQHVDVDPGDFLEAYERLLS